MCASSMPKEPSQNSPWPGVSKQEAIEHKATAVLTRGAAQEEHTHERTLATALPVLIVLLRPYRIIGHALAR